MLEYTGKLITDDEAERRGAIYDRKCVTYLFGVNSDHVVDAARKGNMVKFANHRAKVEANLDVKVITCNGEHRTGCLLERQSTWTLRCFVWLYTRQRSEVESAR